MNKPNALTIVERCPKCKGKAYMFGKHPMPRNLQKTLYPCPHCQEGYIPKMKECSYCGGIKWQGRMDFRVHEDNHSLDKPCYKCKGSGKVPIATAEEVTRAIEVLNG